MNHIFVACFSFGTGINYCANSQCSHICVLKPNGSSCLCPIGMKLDTEQPTRCAGKMNVYIGLFTLAIFAAILGAIFFF